MRPFIAFIYREPNIGFCVTFPDLPGCLSSGGTIAEAIENATGALALYCHQLHDGDTPIPTPSWLHELGPQQPEGLVALIPPPPDVALPRGLTPLF
jgi:predicted RNase H-like HicB family nuclease